MNNMPHKDPTLATALLAWLMDNWPAVYGALLALAIADEEATREGCEWISHFGQIAPQRLRVYRCIESLLGLSDTGDFDTYRLALESLYGQATLDQARALLTREERFFGISPLGFELSGCQLHQRLLEAYGKVHRQHPAGETA